MEEVREIKRPKPLLIIVVILFILSLILMTFGITWNVLESPVDKKNDEVIEVEIPSGTSSIKIGSILKEKELIRSELFFKVYVKLFSNGQMKASTYKFKQSMSLSDIVESLEKGSTYDPNALVLTFKEGTRLTDFASVIEKNTNYSADEFINLTKDKTYLNELIGEYWFLTEDILQRNIYYPLEGYLAPDTYFFDQKVELKEIVETLLNQEEKRLKGYESHANDIHELMTMASIVELEGTNAENRKQIVGVFNNRLNRGMNLGSDVTSYYGVQAPLTRDLTTEEFNDINPYNTRSTTMFGKLPIGPICSPSKSSIDAAINPEKNDYLYFVADKYGKIYYTKTLQEHEKKVQEIKKNGDWIW